MVTHLTLVLPLWHVSGLSSFQTLATVMVSDQVVSPVALEHWNRGWAMKLVHVCYAAIGFAVARWIFKRQPVPVADPVARFRISGLL